MKAIFYAFFVFSFFAAACGGGDTENTTTEDTVALESDTASAENITFEQAWATDTVMETPESVIYDEARDAVYVANIGNVNAEGADGDGFISQMTTDGNITELRWVTGLNDPKGMGIHNDTLYVTDIREIAVISIESGEVINRYPVEGAGFLNDITVDDEGTVYFSDSNTDKIHMLENGQVSTFMSDSSLSRPNGLLAEEGRLLLASANGGYLAPIELETKEVQAPWMTDIPSADGIIRTQDDNYVVSSWRGEVHYVDPENNITQKLLDTTAEEINSADIGYVPDQNLVLVPTFYDNRVVAYRLQAPQM
ncbi:MAG: gluconolaconase [Cyclobacteriaceae bacterium]